MKVSGRPEETEILLKHINSVVARMEQLHTLFQPNSEFVTIFDSSEGRQWAKYCNLHLQSSKEGKTPQTAPNNQSIVNWLDALYPKIRNIIVYIRYISQWGTMSFDQLELAVNKIPDFDLRWNNHLTLSIFSIFVQLSKLALFINKHHLILYYALMIPEAKSDDIANVNRAEFQSYIKFIESCLNEPFTHLKFNFQNMKEKLARFSSNISPFITKIFDTYPLINWDAFSIFNQNKTHPESTLPNDDFLILQNLRLIKETIFYFLFIFPETTISNECLSLYVESLLSECNQIAITNTFRISLDDFLKIEPNTIFNKTLIQAAQLQTKRKFNSSHIQRILRTTFLLKDVLNACKYNKELLPTSLNIITALGGIAYYELECCFLFNATSNTNDKDSIKAMKNEVIQLLSVLIEIARFINQESEAIKRFFIYNIAVIDCQFLSKQLMPEMIQANYGEREVNIGKLIQDLLSSLETLDLPQYDEGVRYEFTPWLISHARYLATYSEMKTRERISFLNPIFEHLTTIRQHIYFATKPIEALLKYVPLNYLWGYSNQFLSIIKNPEISTGILSCLLEIFTYFSYDFEIVRQILNEMQNQKKIFRDIKASLFLRITNELSELLKKDSYQVGINKQSHLFQQKDFFHVRQYATVHEGIKQTLVISQTKSASANSQILKIFEKMPETIVVFEDIDQTAKYFRENIPSTLSKYLINENMLPEFMDLDMKYAAASQILKLIFASLGNSYQRSLYSTNLKESSSKGTTSFDSQIQLLEGKEIPEEQGADNQRIIIKLENRLEELLQKEYGTAIYIKQLRGFYKSSQSEPDPSVYFSSNSLSYLLSNLGLHAGVRIDAILNDQISKSISQIYSNFCELLPQLQNWLSEFSEKGTLPLEICHNQNMNKSIKEIQILSVALTLRSLLREEISSVVENSSPGLKSLLDAAFRRKKPEDLSPKEILLREILSGDTEEMPFIRFRLQEMNIQKQQESNFFYFYLALLFMNNQLLKSKYNASHEYITGNLHLFPTSINAILRVSDLLFDDIIKNDYSSRKENIKGLFSTLNLIILKLKSQSLSEKNQQLSNDYSNYSNVLTIIANIFKSEIPWVSSDTYEILLPTYSTNSFNHAYSMITNN